MKTIYTAKTKTTGGRKGHAKSIDGGPIDLNLSVPKAMGGDGGMVQTQNNSSVLHILPVLEVPLSL